MLDLQPHQLSPKSQDLTHIRSTASPIKLSPNSNIKEAFAAIAEVPALITETAINAEAPAPTAEVCRGRLRKKILSYQYRNPLRPSPKPSAGDSLVS